MSDLYKTKLPINNFVIWAIEMKPYIKKHYNHFSIEEKKMYYVKYGRLFLTLHKNYILKKQ